MGAIFQREWRGFFQSPIGYIFSGVFIALCSFFFVNDSLAYQSADIKVVFSNINIIYLFLVALLTMGLFSNERSKKTDQLLLTSPVSVSQIVIEKYFAAMWVFGITIILSLVYPIVFRLYGATSMSEIVGVYIGFILLGAAFIAIGTFISSLTKNQIVAAIITFGILLVINYLDLFIGGVSLKTMGSVIHWVALMDRYEEFQSGILNIESIIYYLSFGFVFLFLTGQVIRRRQISDRRLRVSNYVMTVMVIAGIVLANATIGVIAEKLPMKIDLTRDNVYEFSEQTKEVLDAVEEEVTIYAMYPPDVEGSIVGIVREYLTKYEQMNEWVQVIYKDPYEEAAFVRQYGGDIELGAVIVEQGERYRVISLDSIYRESSYTASAYVDAEKQITSAISYVAGIGKEVNAYFIKGHDEYGGENSSLAKQLRQEGYSVGEVNIGMEGIPENTDLLIALAPTVDFTAQERDALDAYLLNGGKAAFVFAAGTQPLERLYSYISEWGIAMNSDFVVENDGSRAYRSSTGVPVPAPLLAEHTITEKLLGSDINFISPASCSMEINPYNVHEASVKALLTTTENSWGKKDLSSSTLDMEEGDTVGPLTLAAIAEKFGGSRLFVLGSLQAVETEGVLESASYCNGDFMLNAFSYLTDKEETLDIRSKIISAERLTMSEQQIDTVSVLVQYVLPGFILVIGMVVWLRRRYL